MTPTRFGLSTMHRTSRTISRCFPGLPVLRLTVFFLAGCTAAPDAAAPGTIHRLPGGTEPSGVVEETANGLVRAPIPATSEEEILGRIEGLQEYYASFGVTTVQDGGLDDSALALLSDAGAKGMLYLDIVGFRRVGAGGSIPTDFTISQEYDGHFRVGGIKMVLDGSPQGKTAWLTQPYRVPPHGQPPEYAGYPIFEFNQVYDVMSDAFERGVPVMAHANGDAAADQLIAAVTAANEAVGPGDRRTVMIHAQTAREDQLDQMKAEGIVPSYFVAHTFFWGDWHRDSVLGPERGVRISPLRSTLDRDMPFTIHNDTPVVPSDMMYLMWTAANRVTRSGRVLGNEQRLSGAEALHAVTLGAAYQFFEEGTKGSIEVGKVADFVVLSDNPTTVDRMEIKDIRIEETIKDGVTVFSAAASQE